MNGETHRIQERKFLDKPIPKGKQNLQTERYTRDGLHEPSTISGGMSLMRAETGLFQ